MIDKQQEQQLRDDGSQGKIKLTREQFESAVINILSDYEVQTQRGTEIVMPEGMCDGTGEIANLFQAQIELMEQRQ